MKPDIEKAIEELRERFPDARVVALGTDDGGALVTIDPVDPGPATSNGKLG